MKNDSLLRPSHDSTFRFFISLVVLTAGALLSVKKTPEHFLFLIVVFLFHSFMFGVIPYIFDRKAVPGFLSYILLATDVTAISCAIYLTGGIDSPLFMLYPAVFGLCLYREKFAQFLYAAILSALLYGAILVLSIDHGSDVFKGTSQVLLLVTLSSVLWFIMSYLKREKLLSQRLASQSKSLAKICSLIASSMSQPKDVIRMMSAALDEEVRKYGLQCRIDIHKSGEYFVPPSGPRVAISIPIMMGGIIGGTLLVNKRNGSQLHPSDHDYFSTVANAIGLYCHRVRMWDDFQSQLEKIEATLLLSVDNKSHASDAPVIKNHHKNIKSMIEVLKSERGDWLFEPVPMDFRSLVYEEIELGLSGSPDKKMNLVLTGDFKNIPQLVGDPKRIRQLFQNILQLLVSGSPVGGTVKIGVSYDKGYISFCFEDQGDGGAAGPIAMSFARLFDRRIEDSTSEPDWLNWGLVICKRIVEVHKGHIHAESRGPGKGRMFSFSIPLSPNEHFNATLKISEDVLAETLSS